jgi:lysophospholipase L1-like esterase
MTAAIANLVHQKTAGTGSGALALTPAPGRRSFFSAFGAGGTNAFYYFITHTAMAEWEAGTGHLSDAATLVRDTVLDSSNGGAAVNFSAGRKDVVNDLPASVQTKLLQLASVAVSGSYADLSSKPAIPTLAPGQAKRLVLLGDSITRMNTDGVTGTRSAYWGPRGPVAWAQVRLGFPFYSPFGYDGVSVNQPKGFNAGQGGDTTDNMRARMQADVLSFAPDYVYFMGGTNDITSGRSYSQISADMDYIIDSVIGAGATAIVETITPRTNAVGASDWGSSAQRLLHLQLNHHLRDKAASTRGMILIDPSSRIVDQASANGNAVAAMSADGLHFTPAGGFWRGDALVEALQGRVPDPNGVFFNPADLFDATNNPQGSWLANGQMSGASGTAGTGSTGSVATSWTTERATGSTITATADKGSRMSGSNAVTSQVLTVVSTAAGTSSEIIRLRPTASTITSGINTGDWFVLECGIDVSGDTVGTGAVRGVFLDLQDATLFDGVNTTRTRCLTDQYAVGPFPDVAWSGRLVTPPLQLRGTTGLKPSLQIAVDGTKACALRVEAWGFRLKRLAAAPFSYT